MESRFFAGPTGRLDARLHGPASGRRVLVLHPHPAFHGSMGSRLVYDLCVGLGDAGWRAVRFDFRGVGRSDGAYDEGRGETEDALAVWDALVAEATSPPILIGYSFGAAVALRVAAARPLTRLVLIGVPDEVPASVLDPKSDAAKVRSGTETHILAGTQDPFLSRPGIEALAAALPDGAQVHWFEGAGHFLEPDHNPRVLAHVLRVLGTTT